MKYSTVLPAVAALILADPAYALTPQQERMKSCNAEAADKNLKGDSRKTYMSQCLSAQSKGSALTPQQQKMKQCNADATAKSLKGDSRKTFMQGCLSK